MKPLIELLKSYTSFINQKGRLQIQGEMALDAHQKGAKALPKRGMVGTAFGIGISSQPTIQCSFVN